MRTDKGMRSQTCGGDCSESYVEVSVTPAGSMTSMREILLELQHLPKSEQQWGVTFLPRSVQPAATFTFHPDEMLHCT